MKIEGIPVQFIPVCNELIKEAVEEPVEVMYGRRKSNVLGLEYLIAVSLQTYRPKNRERLVKIFEETKADPKLLKKTLRKFNQFDRYTKFKEMYFEQRRGSSGRFEGMITLSFILDN